MFEEIEIDRLVEASDNLRRRVGNVTELAASVRSIGVLEPLLVTPSPEGFVVVAGHRRLAAARKAELATVPCVIREMDAVERVIAMVVENEQRTDLSPVEAAEGYFRLIDLGMTQRELAKRVGRTAKHVASRLALLELPRSTREGVHRGEVSLGAAQALLMLVDTPDVIEEIVSEQPDDIERAVIRHQSIVERAAAASQMDESPDSPPDETTGRFSGGDQTNDL
ncbi:MAG: ParB/RepB/Spo0J family partition protein, partial [Actinobacteria bacterium]|nr:ParB/RepB/Spo0J family partition protein [Actinomycetota bacterium]